MEDQKGKFTTLSRNIALSEGDSSLSGVSFDVLAGTGSSKTTTQSFVLQAVASNYGSGGVKKFSLRSEAITALTIKIKELERINCPNAVLGRQTTPQQKERLGLNGINLQAMIYTYRLFNSLIIIASEVRPNDVFAPADYTSIPLEAQLPTQ